MKNTILKFATIILLSGVIVACGSGDSNESIQQQIKDYKDEVSQLNIKIKELEQKLEDRNVNEDEFITPVRVVNAKQQAFNHYFQVSGTVDADDKAYISPEINGQVKEILVSEGDRVTAGQLLVRLNTSITENTIEEVKTQLELATTLYEKQKQLWKKNIGSEVQYLQAKNNMESLKSKMQTLQSQLDMAFVKSPINGIVDAIHIEAGELAMPGMQMIQVINLKSLNVKADVSEKYLPIIKKGDIVNLSFPTFPDLKMDVKVHRTGEVVKMGNRTFTVELKIDNIDAKLKPNILALMRFLDFSDEAAIVVPSIIIKKDIVGEYIYVVKDVDGSKIAKKVYISTGLSYNDETMVTDGINTGDLVITEGYSLVTDGTEVKII